MFYENRGDRRASEKERVRPTQRGGVADVDMLIYEPQGFSLTILSFTETERGREKYGGKERERQTARLQNWGALSDRTGENNREGKVIILKILIL